MKLLLRLAGLAALLVFACLAWMYSSATRDPIVRQAALDLPDWPRGETPIRAVLMADIHVAGPDMPPHRLAQIVEQVNGLRPDVVLIAGDFVSDKKPATRRYSAAEALAPLARLRPRLGTVAVLGNHDHWRGKAEIIAALRSARVQLLENGAASIGPLRLGGVDDDFTGQADVERTAKAMRGAGGAKVLLSHSPDIVPRTPADITLILAGHTHCGQIRLPWVGAVSYMSRYGDRFACSTSRDGTKRVVTTAGLGTSILPLRLGAPPEIWLLTLGPPRVARPLV